MDAIPGRDNLNRPYRQVKSNKGVPGIDGLTVKELSGWLKVHKDTLLAALKAGTYEPQAVDIEKPGGGTRRLGIRRGSHGVTEVVRVVPFSFKI